MSIGDIHNRDGRIKKTVQKLENSTEYSKHNKEVILDFKDFLFSQNLSKDRIARYLYSWHQLLQHVDYKLDEVEKDDLIELVGKINQDKIKDRELSEYTKMEYKKAVRKMYTDYLESKNPEFDGETLCDFFSLTVNTSHTDPDRLPTPEVVSMLVQNASRIRDKALIMTLWSSAGRIGEVLGLQWKDVKFSNDITKIRFRDTKTGGSRTVPLRAGYLYLKDLQDSDQRSDESDAFVFRNLTNDKQMSHKAACGILKRARSDTNIGARVKTNPHAFRKGRATFLAAQGMNQAQLCEFGGWAQGSSHVAKYIRMAESDVEEGIRQIAGIQEADEKFRKDLNPVQCYDCNELNKFEAENCTSCGAVLTTSEMFEQKQIEEATDELVFEIAKSETGFTEDEIEKKAQELVEEKYR